MTLPVSPNSISAGQIRTEFGATSGDQNTGPVRLGAYRIKQSVSGLNDLPLDTDIPNSVAVGNSAIGFGNLRGKKLNVVIDYTVPSGQWKTKVNARQDYNDNNNITVIGGFKTRPPSSAGTKVIIHTNGNIGSYVYLSRSYKGVYGYLHFYASPSESRSAGYTIESKYYIRMFPRQEPNTTPLYRLYSPTTLDHLYTIDVNEWNKSDSGYNQQRIVGYVYGYAAPSTNPVYRGFKVYNPPGGDCRTIIDRLYTFDVNELYNNGFSVDYGGNPAFYAPAFVSEASKGIRNSCSLLTGSWEPGTDLNINIGPSGGIYGDGGDGGDGGGGSGSNGGQGTTALAIQYPVTIINQGTIFAGRGGGGGGAGGIGYKHADTQRGCQKRQDCVGVGGGGGAGGRGYPGGTGGYAGQAGSCRGVQVSPTKGGDGSSAANGGAGARGVSGESGGCDGAAVSGAGGGVESSGGNGNNASGNGNPWSVGQGGSRGYAVIIDSAGSLISYTGNARDGDTYTSAQVGASV